MKLSTKTTTNNIEKVYIQGMPLLGLQVAIFQRTLSSACQHYFAFGQTDLELPASCFNVMTSQVHLKSPLPII